ncbi:unnamed protein product [Rotaria magnacalcarata]|uniref:SPRY domain-containing protein n=3 Tax=Rotaria magnacalcarata TaxID=392030 RepID=A0A816T3D4_9BILA|nr:unnamed protein product [Rotaria magnacalcarata]
MQSSITYAILIKKTQPLKKKLQRCNLVFYRNDFDLHRAKIDQDLDIFADELNAFQSGSGEQYNSLELMLSDKINTWKLKSIQKIQEDAEEARQQVQTLIALNNGKTTSCVHKITQELKQDRQNHGFDERDLNKWKKKLDELKLNVSKSDLYIDEQQSENDFITNLLAKEKESFERVCGPVSIKENVQLASHNFNIFPISGEFVAEDNIILENSYQSNSSYGWAGHNEVYTNGKCSKKVNGYTSDYSKGDVIELTLDCDHHLIRMANIRSTKSYEINVDLKDCPFPWMLHLNLFHHQTRIRVNLLKVSRKQ